MIWHCPHCSHANAGHMAACGLCFHRKHTHHARRGPYVMKAKIHAVTLFGKTFLVSALTRQGAVRALLNHANASADVELATGAQMYEAGRRGESIIGGEKHVDDVDPAQAPLPIEKESQA